MAAGLVQLAKRAFVSLLLALAQQYRVRVTLTRDSADHAVEAAFRSVVKKFTLTKAAQLVMPNGYSKRGKNGRLPRPRAHVLAEGL